MIKERFGPRYENPIPTHKSSYESASNKPKSLIKISPTTQNITKSGSKNIETSYTSSNLSHNSHNSLPVRKNSSSIILDLVAEENCKKPEPIIGNGITSVSSASKVGQARNYSTREYIKLTEDANSYIQDNLALAKKNIDTARNLKKKLFIEEEELFTIESNPVAKPAEISNTSSYQPISCRFRTHLKQYDTANNSSSVIFSTNAVKPRVTVADLYLKPPTYTPKGLFGVPTPSSGVQTTKAYARPEDSYVSCGNLLSGNYNTANITTSHSSAIKRFGNASGNTPDIKKPSYHRNNSSIGYASQKPYTGLNIDPFSNANGNSNAGPLSNNRRSYRPSTGTEGDLYGNKKYFGSSIPSGRVGMKGVYSGNGNYNSAVSSEEYGENGYRSQGAKY